MAEVKIHDAPPSTRTYIEKGITALERNNLEYAMDMFEVVLTIEPRLLEVRTKLRLAMLSYSKAYPANKASGPRNLKTLIQASSWIKKDPLKALPLAEKLMRSDPFNIKYQNVFFDSSVAAELPEAAIMTFELLKKEIPKDVGLLERLAILYLETGDFDNEFECRTTITKIIPNDSVAQKNLKDAAARLTMGRAGWKNAAVIRNVIQEDDAMDNGYAVLQENLKSDSDNPNLLRSLAQLQLANKVYDDAIDTMEHLQKVLDVADPQIDRKILLARELQLAGKVAVAEDTNDSNEITRLRNEIRSMRLNNAAKQIERYPNDLLLKFDYGKLLLENAQYSEAIQQLQYAQKNPQRKIRCLIYLSNAFKEKGQIQRAIDSLNIALGDLPDMTDQKKEVLYELGLLTEATSGFLQAQQIFMRIYSIDIGYRDVAMRIETTPAP